MRRKWHTGPPPHVGWWEASRYSRNGVWRWWNGDKWSIPVLESDNETYAEVFAYRSAAEGLSDEIMWTTYWPKNARVPRVRP